MKNVDLNTLTSLSEVIIPNSDSSVNLNCTVKTLMRFRTHNRFTVVEVFDNYSNSITTVKEMRKCRFKKV